MHPFLGKSQSTDIAILRELAKTRSRYSIKQLTVIQLHDLGSQRSGILGQESVDLFTGVSFVVIHLRGLGLQTGILGVQSLVLLFLTVQVLIHFGEVTCPL